MQVENKHRQRTGLSRRNFGSVRAPVQVRCTPTYSVGKRTIAGVHSRTVITRRETRRVLKQTNHGVRMMPLSWSVVMIIWVPPCSHYRLYTLRCCDLSLYLGDTRTTVSHIFNLKNECRTQVIHAGGSEALILEPVARWRDRLQIF